MSAIRNLSRSAVAERLSGPGLALHVGPLVARLATSLGELVEPVRTLYGGFDLADQEPLVDFEVRVAPGALARRWVAPQARVFVDGQRAFAPFPRRHALPMLEWAMNWCVFTRPNQYLLLHSAVVERGGRALLLPGRPGAGKSTLAAGLVLRGWRLLSDEVAIVPPGTTDVVPAPRPVGLKDGSIDVVRRFDGGAVLGPSTPGTRKGTVAHMRPPDDSVARGIEPACPAWIVFPRFASGAPVELSPVSRPEAFLRVAHQSFNYSVLGTVGFETLAAVFDRCSCHMLRYGDLGEAVRALDALVAQSAGGGAP
jgi:HprK-related kinase A